MWTRETMEAALQPSHEAADPMRQVLLIEAADTELQRLKALDAMDAERQPDHSDDYRTIPRATIRRWVTAELHGHLDALGLPHSPAASVVAA